MICQQQPMDDRRGMEIFDSLSGLSAVVDAMSNNAFNRSQADDTTAQDAQSVLSLGSIGIK